MAIVMKIVNGEIVRPGDIGFDAPALEVAQKPIIECDPVHVAHSLPTRKQLGKNHPAKHFVKNRAGDEIPVFHTKQERIEFQSAMRDMGYNLSWDQS